MLKVFANLTHTHTVGERNREREELRFVWGWGMEGSKRRIALLFMTPSYCAINRPPTADGDSGSVAAAAAAIG